MIQNYHFTIKKLAEDFRGEEFGCLGENTKNILAFQFQLKKNMIMILVKQSHAKQSLLIVVDLCQVNYQILLITCLKLIIKIARHAWKEKILNQNVNLLDLKIIDEITDANNAIENLLNQ